MLARELTVQQIAAVHKALGPVDAPGRANIEFFIHGALCVAYSGQCNISHAQTGRSANRGDCSQACRLPYQVTDAQGRFIAHDKHVLSMKDNNQSDNLRALIDAGVRSFKIEARKDMGYVKNITAHYRTLLDEIIEEREARPAAVALVQRAHHLHLHTRPAAELQPRVHRLLRHGQRKTSAPSTPPRTLARPSAGSTKVGRTLWSWK